MNRSEPSRNFINYRPNLILFGRSVRSYRELRTELMKGFYDNRVEAGACVVGQ